MKDFDQLKKQLKKLIIDKGIKYTIKSLKKDFADSSKLDTLLLIETANKKHQENILKGILGEEEKNRRSAEILDRLFKFIDSLEKEDLRKKKNTSNSSKRESFKKGHVLYQIPKKMQAFNEARCRVRIAFDELMIWEGLTKQNDIDVKSDVRVSDYMRVEILDPNSNSVFEIRSNSELIQFIDQDDFTEWFFYVKPLLPGKHILELKVSLIILINGKEIKREKVLHESVVIVSEEVEEEETEFVKAMEDMVVAYTKVMIGDETINQKPALRRSSKIRLPKKLKAFISFFSFFILLITAGYAFYPPFTQEVDRFWAYKIIRTKKAIEKFETKYPITKFLPDSYEDENSNEIKRVIDSIRIIDSIALADEIETKKITDSIALANEIETKRIADSIALANEIETKRIADSIALANEIEAKRITDSIALANEIKTKRIADSIALANEIETKRIADSISLANEIETKRIADSISLANEIETKRIADSIAIVLANKYKKGSFIDSRDGQEYPIILIDGRWWMAKNLAYDIGKNSFCFNEDEKNCKEYGRLYNWKGAKKACPKGWSLPSDKEWIDLLTKMGGYFDNGRKKQIGENPKKGYRLLEKEQGIGFNATLGGYSYRDKAFKHDAFIDTIGIYRTSTSTNFTLPDAPSKKNGIILNFNSDKKMVFRYIGSKDDGYSCRCIKDEK